MGNISKIRIQNTDYAVKDSRVDGKVDKPSSSTDNAVVRFDSTPGSIQNSGVTINDSNHLTAAKFITSGGTSSQFVKGDGSLDSNSYASSTNAVKNGDYLVSNHITLTDSIKERVFDRNSQDTFFAANSRFVVTHKRYSSTDDSFINNLSTNIFQGTYGYFSNTVLDGEYGLLYIGNVAEDELSATTSTTDCICTYPQGSMFITFYTSMRCGEILEAKGWFRNSTTWSNLTVVANNTVVYQIQIPSVNYLKAVRIKYSGSDLGSEKKTSLTDVAYIRYRDDLTARNLITKYPVAQQMYGNLTAPKFITSGGISSQFVKGDGSLDSNTYLTSSSLSTYAPKASPALTGTPTAPTAPAGTNTTQIATTAFVNTKAMAVEAKIPKDYQEQYFTFVAREDATFSQSHNAMMYSLDGVTWTTLAKQTSTPTITAGNKIMWKATNPTINSSVGIGYFYGTGKFDVQGNIMSLVYGDNFIGKTDLSGKAHVFRILFYNNTNIVNAENLILPATTLADYCYKSMFSGCSNLETTPVLCATELVSTCYESMFVNCLKVKYIKALFTTTPGRSYTYNWLYDVSSTGTFVKNDSATWEVSGANGIPTGWTVRTESEMEHVTKGELDDVIGNIETLLASI